MAEMKPGPAFIPWDEKHSALAMLRREWVWPEGYEWQAQTESTMAGWVRRKGNSDKK